jgi:2-methylisocitrate lyase-like PEP mutase family enzyme
VTIIDEFRVLHVPGQPLLMPNPWDVGSARLLASLGFRALATTSAGFAGTLGRPDGAVAREEALAHAADLVAAVDLPVSADLENCFADDLAGVSSTASGAAAAGLAGFSIEDWSGSEIYDVGYAAERVAAATSTGLVVTARAENHLHGKPDLADTIARLQAYQEAGAGVLYAPGISSIADVRSVVSSVDRPVNVLVWPGLPPVAGLAEAGVARISVGGAFALASVGALTRAARELLDVGSYGFLELAVEGRRQTATYLGEGGPR